jgi:hypothetical protein
MSTKHDQLVHACGAGSLDDPSSKNGALVGGLQTRASTINLGQVWVGNANHNVDIRHIGWVVVASVSTRSSYVDCLTTAEDWGLFERTA